MPGPSPSHPRRGLWCPVLNIVALALWLASLLTGGVSAAILFPAMKSLDPRLPAYERYTGEHWKLAAGMVQDRIFQASFIGQVVFGAAALVTLVLMLTGAATSPLRRRPASVVLRVAGAAAAVALIYNSLTLMPRMQVHLNEYWSQAKAGHLDEAETARAAFDADHPTASRTLVTATVAVFTAFASAAWILSTPNVGRSARP